MTFDKVKEIIIETINCDEAQITMDADLKEDSFRQFICENWWPIDKNLVPSDWYENTSQQ